MLTDTHLNGVVVHVVTSVTHVSRTAHVVNTVNAVLHPMTTTKVE